MRLISWAETRDPRGLVAALRSRGPDPRLARVTLKCSHVAFSGGADARVDCAAPKHRNRILAPFVL